MRIGNKTLLLPYLAANVVVLVLLLPAVIQAQEQVAASSSESGLVDFSTSCDAAVTSDFNRATELLHSFEYPASEAVFRAILEVDPTCSMARWGVAMNMWHPLWALPGQDALEAGAAMLDGIDYSTVTAREAGFIDALALFYADNRAIAHRTRALAYQDRMAQVYMENLDDPEAAIFYALSLLATADPTDKGYGNQFKAAGLLNWVRESQPYHPGVLHSLIHSYDNPGLAHLALNAAMIYADVAPDSAHAQHMPSHIFTRLGMWDRSISSNHDSTASAAEYTERAQLPGHYDEGLHSIDYLMYALLQMARDAEAKQLLDDLRAIGKTNLDNFKVAFAYASSPARYALETRQWVEASQIELLPTDFPWEEFGWARSIHHFARGIGAARSGNLESANKERDTIREIAAALPDATLPYWREEVFVHEEAVSSWIALIEGDPEAALRLARTAADREDAVDKHPVTPGEVLPARELLADMLLQLERGGEALEHYQIVLIGSPNRANALLGAARAAAQSGDAVVAAAYYQTFLGQTESGNQSRDGVREARAYLAARD